MDDGGPTASYIIFLVLLLVDMLFYGFGAAAKELNAKELSDQIAENGSKKAKRLYRIVVHPEQYINTVQFVVSLINLIIGGFFWKMYGSVPLILSGALLLYILLTFGVLIPKRLGTKYAEKWAFACINPIYYATMIFLPVTGLISVTAKGVLLIFGIRGGEETEDVTEEEIISMVNEGHEQGVLLATEAEMITNIFEFGDKEAQDIMTHRKNILAIDRNMTLEDALDFMLSESKSRFPVYEENIDNIIGILHFRDAMRSHIEEENLLLPVGDIEGLIRETMFVPETKNIDDLFRSMQSEKNQMVIVMDEYGQTSGLVTMEDILEEIVGNIMDEYDPEENHIEEKGENEYVIEGMTKLEDLNERFGISFGETEFETLNGYLISKLDRIPDEDENSEVEVDGYTFQIVKVEKNVIQSVLVKKVEQGQPESEQDIEPSENI